MDPVHRTQDVGQARLPGPPATPGPTATFVGTLSRHLHIADEAAKLLAADMLQAFNEGLGKLDLDKLRHGASLKALAHPETWRALATFLKARTGRDITALALPAIVAPQLLSKLGELSELRDVEIRRAEANLHLEALPPTVTSVQVQTMGPIQIISTRRFSIMAAPNSKGAESSRVLFNGCGFPEDLQLATFAGLDGKREPLRHRSFAIKPYDPSQAKSWHRNVGRVHFVDGTYKDCQTVADLRSALNDERRSGLSINGRAAARVLLDDAGLLRLCRREGLTVYAHLGPPGTPSAGTEWAQALQRGIEELPRTAAENEAHAAAIRDAIFTVDDAIRQPRFESFLETAYAAEVLQAYHLCAKGLQASDAAERTAVLEALRKLHDESGLNVENALMDWVRAATPESPDWTARLEAIKGEMRKMLDSQLTPFKVWLSKHRGA